VLKHLPVTHALLAPLALVGLVLAARSRFRSISAPLYLLVLTHLAALLGFFVYARHRVPLQLALMPFAAFAVVQTVVWIRERRRSAASALLVALLLIGGWTLRPLPAERPIVRAADYLAPHKIYYTPRFNAAAAAGDWERVVTLIEDVLRLEPDWIGAGSPVTFDRFTMTRLYGNLRLNRARALERIGRQEEALAEYERARELRTIGDEIEAQLRLSPRVGD